MFVREKNNFDNINKKIDFLSKQKNASENDFDINKNWNLGNYMWNDVKLFILKLNEELDKIHYKKIREINKKRQVTVSRKFMKDFVIIKSIEDWIDLMMKKTGLNYYITKNILHDLTYDKNIKNSDLSLQYFIPIKNHKLMISTLFINFNVRPQRNLLSLIPKINKSVFDSISNDCEEIQKEIINSKIVNKNIIFAEGKSKEQKLRPAMDALFLDKETRQLLVCELKWNIPASSTKEIIELDNKVKKAVDRINGYSKRYVEEHIDTILEEYFGEEWHEICVSDYECIGIISESIGTGEGIPFNAPIITVDHLIELINCNLSHTFNVIRNGMRGCYSNNIKEEFVKLYLADYEINGVCYKM